MQKTKCVVCDTHLLLNCSEEEIRSTNVFPLCLQSTNKLSNSDKVTVKYKIILTLYLMGVYIIPSWGI